MSNVDVNPVGTAVDYNNLVTTIPDRFPTINPTLLPAMQVLETISTEAIISARMQQLQAIWMGYDPLNAAAYDLAQLEFDPLKINQETSTYFELMVRDRVNQACRAVTLANAIGPDLDNLASNYPYGMPRNTGELDVSYRQRIWLSPNILSLNGPGQGTYESYVFWALNAPMPVGENPLASASAMTVPGTGTVVIPIMSGTPFTTTWQQSFNGKTWTLAPTTNPIPTAAQIAAVYNYISAPSEGRKGLTDVIQVVPPKVTSVAIKAQIWTYPGVDQDTIMPLVAAAMLELIQDLYFIGADLTQVAIETAMGVAGVFEVTLVGWTGDTNVGEAGAVNVTNIQLSWMGTGQ